MIKLSPEELTNIVTDVIFFMEVMHDFRRILKKKRETKKQSSINVLYYLLINSYLLRIRYLNYLKIIIFEEKNDFFNHSSIFFRYS